MEPATFGWLAVAALVLAGLAFVTSAYLAVMFRSWAREDRAWKANFSSRFMGVEARIMGTTLPETPQLQPAFGRDSRVPEYGSPPGSDSGEERATWAPPSKRQKR